MNSSEPSLVQLQVRQGAAVGHVLLADQLPLRLGRSKECQMQVTEEGVWEQHGEIDINACNSEYLVFCKVETKKGSAP